MQLLHRGQWCDIFQAQPADAAGSPRCDYVVKIVRDDLAIETEAVRQIRSEATIGQTARHPHLIPVLDSDLQSLRPFVVMPRIEGTTLARAAGATSQPIPVALWWVRQAAQALAAIHATGWTHGDIKPENLIVDHRGHLTVVDLGFARKIGDTFDGVFRGTPKFAAPEMIAGEKITATSDVYALGKILDSLLATHVNRGSSVEQIISAMTFDRPEQRPTADDLVEQLLQLEIATLHLHIDPAAIFPSRAA
jgi:serine/threonine protein kinase